MAYTTTRQFWNPKIETATKPDLHRLQLRKLQKMVAWSYENSQFHRQKYDAAGFHPDQIQSLADLGRIPFMTKSEWLANQAAGLPFGTHITAAPRLIQRWHQTSGTSGRSPLHVADGIKDWQWGAELWALCFWAAGVRREDIVYIAFAYGSFIGFWGAHYGSEKLGATVMATGGKSSIERLQQIFSVGATTVCFTPTYALRLAEVARDQGLDLSAGSVKRVILSGEPGGSIPAIRRSLEELWGAEVFDTAGMSEVGSNVMFECSHHPGALHIIEDHVLEETVDADGQPVGYGEEGERVVTSFGRGLMPLIRYRTGDLVKRVPNTTCGCGRVYDLYEGGILGRVDDMKVIRGINVFPSSIESIVREFPEIEEFQIVLTRARGIYDEIMVHCELRTGDEVLWPQIQPRLEHALAAGHGGLRMAATLAASGQLPRFDAKSRRMVDQRGL